MGELPKYIKSRISFDVVELEMLIESICKTSNSFKEAERFINRMVVEYECTKSNKGLSDYDKDNYYDWLDILNYFELHRMSFKRQYFGYGSI